MRDRLLHLVTGETAGNMDAAQQTVGVLLCDARGFDQRVGIEPVASVRHRDLHSAPERIRCHRMGELEDRLRSVQEIQLAGRLSKVPGKQGSWLNDFRRRLGGRHGILLRMLKGK